MRWLNIAAAQHQAEGRAREPLPSPRYRRRPARSGGPTPVPDTLSGISSPVAARQEGRTGRLQDRAAEGAGRGRDRARGPGQPRRVWRRGPLRRYTGYYNSVEKFPCSPERYYHAAEPDAIDHCRPPDEPSVLGEALNEAFIRSSSSGSRRSSISAAARGLQLSDRRGVDEEGLRRHAKRVMMGVELPAVVQ